MIDSLICPNCKKPIQISQALRSQIEEEVSKDLVEKIAQVRQTAFKEALKNFEENYKLEQKDLQKQLAEKEGKLVQYRESELQLREVKRKLEERGKEMELEISRKLDAERKKVEEEVIKKSAEVHRLKDLEKDKYINDLKKSLEEAQRKASLTSQQLQGEVLELDLEELLRTNFSEDNIEPVAKGTGGADIKHIVKSPRGFSCGMILWEFKRTKAWSDGWLGKLKDDLRREKANVPVIVSTSLPNEAKSGIGLKEGVWICSLNFVSPLAVLLRKSLLDVARQKVINMHKGDKAEMLYEYVTSHEFKQQVEALVEVYREMTEQVSRERAVFEKSWKAREMQIKRLIFSTASVYGSLQGLIGSSLPQVKGLDVMELESGEK